LVVKKYHVITSDLVCVQWSKNEKGDSNLKEHF